MSKLISKILTWSQGSEYFPTILTVLTITWVASALGLEYAGRTEWVPVAVIGLPTLITGEILMIIRVYNRYKSSKLFPKKPKGDSKDIRILGPNNFSLFWAAMLQKPEDRESTLGCLEERFKEDFERFGKSRAYKLFWRDVLMSIYPAVEGKFSRIVKWSIWGYIFEKFISR